MSNKFWCSLLRRQQATRSMWSIRLAVFAMISCVCCMAGDAPQWMHAQAQAVLPAYDEKTDAVLLYSDTQVTVVSADKIKTTVREAYKILRPNGRARGFVHVYFNPQRKIKSIHGWCIPARGKDFEVKDKEATETSPSFEGAELISDVKFKVLQIPAAEPGNIVGYEYEVEEQPFFLQDAWDFQGADPMRESHYSLLLPPGWEFKASWINHEEVSPLHSGGNSWDWTVSDVKGIRSEPLMPPMAGVAGQMIVSFFSTSAPALNANANWNAMGKWYVNLVGPRVDASPEIKQQVSTLTTGKTTLQKMQALGAFAQHDIRYVGIELGIGGFQPHPAPEVSTHRYGDCKDKATLMRS